MNSTQHNFDPANSTVRSVRTARTVRTAQATNHGRSQLRNRRGFSLILVLFLMGMAVAVSYSMMLTQNTMATIDENLDVEGDTRAAAFSGLSDATRTMHLSTWAGVNSKFTKSLDDEISYEVSYAVGDSDLSDGDDDWNLYPYRVTVTVKATWQHPFNAARSSSHTIETVYQLIPTYIEPDSKDWTKIENYTLAQLSTTSAIIEPTTQILGDAIFMGAIDLFSVYQPNSSVREQLFTDIKAMYDSLGTSSWGSITTWVGLVSTTTKVENTPIDMRPFGGDITAKKHATSNAILNEMTTYLGLTVTEKPGMTNFPLTRPNSLTSYQLYTGGPAYSVTDLYSIYGNSLSNVSLSTDPMTNPLGLYYSSSSLIVGSNVTMEGSLIVDSDLDLSGNTIQFSSPELLNVETTSTGFHLPTIMAESNLTIKSNSSVGMDGLVIAWSGFTSETYRSGNQATINGKLWCTDFASYGVDEWDDSPDTWGAQLTSFAAQSAYLYFPLYLANSQGISLESALTIQPNSTPWTYHWNDWATPLYTAHPDDDGLRWEMIRITESP